MARRCVLCCAALFAVAWSTESELCRQAGENTINFGDATPVYNNLGGQGPNTGDPPVMRFGSVGTTVDGSPIDLVVSNVTEYVLANPIMNGLSTYFGAVNMMGQPTLPDARVVRLRFSFVDGTTGVPVDLTRFFFSFFDFDQAESNNAQECLTIVNDAFTHYALSDRRVSSAGVVEPLVNEVGATEVAVTPDTLDGANASRFCSTQAGGGTDNPTDPADLTPTQIRRSVEFTFEEQGDFEIELSIGCCTGGGRNFAFAGQTNLDGLPLCNPPPYWDGLTSPAPSLVDLDGDGLLDLIVGTARDGLSFFKNVDGVLTPSWLAYSSLGDDLNPAVADLDGDSLPDVVIGTATGELAFLVNVGSSDTAGFSVADDADSPVAGINVGQGSAPTLADLDADGRLDLIVGDESGVLHPLQNTGSAFSADWDRSNQTGNSADSETLVPGHLLFPGLGVPAPGGWSSPTAADLDGDGDLDLVVGNREGTLQMLENVGGVYSLLDDDASPVSAIQLSNYTHPSLADVDGDGDADLLVGAADNELHYFENVGTSSVPSFVARYGDDVPLGLGSLRSDERVRLRLSLGSELLDYTWDIISEQLMQAIGQSDALQDTGIGQEVYQIVAGSTIVTFELYIDNSTHVEQSGSTPLGVAYELACEIEHSGDALHTTQIGETVLSEMGLLRVHKGGYLERIECPAEAPSPPPPSPPLPIIVTTEAAVTTEEGLAFFVYPVAAAAALAVLLLCCCRLCLPAIVRGFCGRWAQLNLTHSNAKVPPLYLPKEQRDIVHDEYYYPTTSTALAMPTAVSVFDDSSADNGGGEAHQVTLVKKYPNQPVGLGLIDLLTDAHGWKLVTTERAPGRQSKDGAKGAYYMHAATRAAVSATASQHELAPRVYELAPAGLAALSGGGVQLGDSILAVDGCTGNAALLTKRLAEAPFKTTLLVKRPAQAKLPPGSPSPRTPPRSPGSASKQQVDAAAAETPKRSSGRRRLDWINDNIGWWRRIDGARPANEEWLRTCARIDKAGAGKVGKDASSGGDVDEEGSTGAARIAPSVPSAELRLWPLSFSLQLRREVPNQAHETRKAPSVAHSAV